MLALLLTLALHPLHTTHTTISVAAGGRIDIEIRAFTDDLHAATTRHGGAVSDSAIAQYVRAMVGLTDGGGRAVALTWDGTQPDGDVTRIHLHGGMAGDLARASLRQAMQADLFDDQVNVVQIRFADRRLSLLFTPGDKAKTLS